MRDKYYQLQKQIDFQNIRYEKIANSFKSIKRIIHDTNKQLLYIRTCIQENEPLEAIEHINKTFAQIDRSYLRVATGNLVIDALVSNALNVAHESGINMEHKIHINAEDINIDRYDLCVVIGNVLDNAVEATQLISKTDNRFIRLQIHSNNNSLIVHVINSFNKNAEQNRSTTREKNNFHGIGLLNIQKVAETYGGHLTTSVKDNQFETIIVLPFKD